MKLKDDKTCHCPYRNFDGHDPVLKLCRAGYCTLYLCEWCGRILFEAGPIDCPHKKRSGNGTLRWYKYPDMDTKPHVPVKKNRARRRKR